MRVPRLVDPVVLLLPGAGVLAVTIVGLAVAGGAAGPHLAPAIPIGVVTAAAALGLALGRRAWRLVLVAIAELAALGLAHQLLVLLRATRLDGG